MNMPVTEGVTVPKGFWDSIAMRYATLVASLDQEEREQKSQESYIIVSRDDYYTIFGSQEGSLSFPGSNIPQGHRKMRAQADTSLKGVALLSKEEASQIISDFEAITGQEGFLVMMTPKEWKLWLLPRLRELNFQSWKLASE